MHESVRRTLSFVATPAIAGGILTILAPLGTHTSPLLPRAAFWIGLCFAGGLGAMAVRLLVNRFRPTIKGWRRIVLQSLGSTLAVAPFVIIGGNIRSPSGMLMTLIYIWIIAMVITTFGELTGQQAAAGHETGPAPDAKRPALIEKLPMKFRDATLYAVTSEDHYVRIYTSQGEHMMLMRLADVDALAQPISGLRPHRSWWVAEAGVATVERSSGKLTLVLKNDIRVPVSRSGAAAVRDAGWLEGG